MHSTQTSSPTGSGLCQKWATDQPMTSTILSWSPHSLSCMLTWSCMSTTLSGWAGFQRSTTTPHCPSWERWSKKWNLSSTCCTVRCWGLKHQSWLRQRPPSPLISPISLTSCNQAMNFSNTSSSFAIGRTERFSALNPKSLQFNDNPLTKRLQSQWECMESHLSQREIRTMSPVCTVVKSIPYEAQTSTNDVCWRMCLSIRAKEDALYCS